MIVQVTDEEKQRCFQFAEQIIGGKNQYNRFEQSPEVQILRTYIGKLAEYIFLHFLHSRGIEYDEGDMFEIFEGEENADTYDFILPSGLSVDIKTASRSFHTRIMIPINQFHLKKDYYVGIKLNFEVTGNQIQPFSIKNCVIHGFTTRDILEQQPIQNFGEGNCKAFSLYKMKDIEELITLFYEP